MLVGPHKPVSTPEISSAALLLLAVLLFVGACSNDPQEDGPRDETEALTAETGATTPTPQSGQQTTEDTAPEVTLGQDPGDRPEVMIRLEGDPETTFTGLCSVGEEQNVLSGRIPERFTFDLAGERLDCRIVKRGEDDGDLKVVLVAGDTTRSVQQTNSPDGVINVSYESE
jgi:hypothetical protein